MPKPNNEPGDNQDDPQNNKLEDDNLTADERVQAAIQKAVDDKLKDIKAKLDNAYAARDDAKAKLAELEAAKREAEIKKLKEDGKVQEAYEKQLEDERAARKALENRNRELTRDLEVRSALATLDFRTEKARANAFREIVDDLVQDEKGVWLHKSGSSIQEHVRSFHADADNSYLFKAKINSGGGGGGAQPKPGSGDAPKSLFGLTQAEVMKLAAEGKLPNQRKR